jgi:hypothetical protein
MKPALLLWSFAAVLVVAGVVAFLSAPKGANAKTALIVPGACAVLVAVCALLAGGTLGGAGAARTGRVAGTVLAFVIAALVGWRAWSAGTAVRAYRDAEAGFAAEVAAGRAERTDPARIAFFEARGAPDHDKSYLRNLLWGLAGAGLLAGALLATSRTEPAAG